MNAVHRAFITPFLLVLIALVLTGGGAYLYTQKRVSDLNASTTAVTQGGGQEINETGYTYDYTYETLPDGSVSSPQQLHLVSPSKTRIIVPTDIAMAIDAGILLQKADQVGNPELASSLMPIDPTSKNAILLSTREVNPKTNDRLDFLNKLYSYDLDTHTLKLLSTYEDIIFAEAELRLLGTQGSKVIVNVHTVGTGGPCGNAWIDAPERLKYYDLDNPASGFQIYHASAAKIAEEEAKQVACLKDLGIGD